MNGQAVDKLLQRINRLRNSIADKSGSSFQWDYTFPEGDTHTYIFRNMKSPQVMQDDIINCFIWTWSLKDYLKAFAISKGKSGDYIEEMVNSDVNLQLCADLANVEKHGKLRKKNCRSGIFPKFGDVSFSVPREGIKQLAFGAYDVTLDISDPSKVEFTLPIIANNGSVIADGFSVLEYSVTKLENVFTDLQVAA